MISTIFDDPAHTDPHEPLKRRHEPYHLNYRDEVKFNQSKEKLNPVKFWNNVYALFVGSDVFGLLSLHFMRPCTFNINFEFY